MFPVQQITNLYYTCVPLRYSLNFLFFCFIFSPTTCCTVVHIMIIIDVIETFDAPLTTNLLTFVRGALLLDTAVTVSRALLTA